MICFFVFVPRTSGAASIVAEHILPAKSTSWFSAGAGMGTDGKVYDNRQAQTFTTISSGYLNSISFNSYRYNTTNADLRISVTSMIGGQPRAVLESIIVKPTAISSQSLSSAFLLGGNFSNTIMATGNLLLQANTQYAIVFSSSSIEANYRLYGDYSAYSGGSNLSNQNSGLYRINGGNLLFQVSATPIPEPGSLTLYIFSALLLGTRRRRSQLGREASTDHKLFNFTSTSFQAP
jgi:hypothetical protein